MHTFIQRFSIIEELEKPHIIFSAICMDIVTGSDALNLAALQTLEEPVKLPV